MTVKKPIINIHKIGAAEIPVLVKYRLLYLTELQGEMSVKYRKKLILDLTLYFKKALAGGSFFALYAEVEGKIVSFGGMIIKEIPGDINKSTYLEGDILNMYTIPKARRKGISSVILENLLTEAKKMGISKVALHTSKDGEKLYRKYKFSEPAYPYLELVISNHNFTH